MNPVRAGIVTSPELYRWSSYRVRSFGEKSPVVDLDPWYNSLADSETWRQLKYREFFQNLAPESTCKLIREMTKRDGIVGGEGFKELIEKLTHKEIIFRSLGRPKKSEK